MRGPWLQYLKSNNLQPRDLLKDDVHLNDHGNSLLAELVKRDLVHRPDLPDNYWTDLVRDYEVGKDVHWKGRKLTLAFEGNRVDVIADGPAEAGGDGPVEVRIDGKTPSEFPGCYVGVGQGKPMLVEDWTLKVTEVSADSSNWKFQVTGSKTGPDGTGSGDAAFVSNSARVTIEPADFFRNGNIPAGYTIRWQVRPTFVDRCGAGIATVAQGLPNGRHTLELIGGGNKNRIRAVRIFRPAQRG